MVIVVEVRELVIVFVRMYQPIQLVVEHVNLENT